MAVTIELKRSSVPGKVPNPTQLGLGELAINTYDGKIYYKKNVSGIESVLTLVTSNSTGSILVDSASDGLLRPKLHHSLFVQRVHGDVQYGLVQRLFLRRRWRTVQHSGLWHSRTQPFKDRQR